ncbi:MAG: RnfABCDGE type electron transport complex subunit D [Bacteroidales bacterium]|jgi:electron transport complex protein RnfD|nr:RnfABCDGE type electron transport complex subunit D [Bacteroidales bacterium]MBO7305660.1 RnfABCDGE type electron transport complex subunit D [Bacteroidales bacterium]MBQ1219553.1 RnfABCDGE type electron transport complex subunit D [Bacteroidales bacterium]MBQ1929159.1 RnfABCDGE type electron transport complex subunit D [Bacteroidales bacterium]MBQ5783393.1 RnfABCDGE type electron transport complex subunit D [Bacteroidales bacterium]
MKKLLVSPSPHIHGKESTQSLMRDVVIALLPSVAVSIYCFGLAAIKLTLIGVLACVAVEYIIAKYMMKTKPTICDYSAVVTGILLALNVPAGLPWWIMVIGCIVAIGIAKMSFGGLGQNLFNPALVGRVFLLISFPVAMTTWTTPESFFGSVEALDAASGATPLAVVKESLAKGMTLPEIFAANNFSYTQMLFVRIGSAGEISAIALLLGFIYLLVRRVIRPTITLSVWAGAIVLSGILWLCNPDQFTDPIFTMLTGGMLLGSIFMATDYVTSPMSTKGMIIFGVGIGVLTVLIRQFGAYPEGISFAILIMNATVPLINMYCKPKRFGK